MDNRRQFVNLLNQTPTQVSHKQLANSCIYSPETEIYKHGREARHVTRKMAV